MTTRNEAAERLLRDFPMITRDQIREALAVERRATVERIRQALRNHDQPKGTSWAGWIDAILDEEAAG